MLIFLLHIVLEQAQQHPYSFDHLPSVRTQIPDNKPNLHLPFTPLHM